MHFKWVPTTYVLYMLGVLIWIALTSWCNSNELQHHTLLYICCGYSSELHWQIDAFQIGTNNIRFYIYVVGTPLNSTDKLMHFKWVPTTYILYMSWVLLWIALTSWCISNGYQQHTHLYICCGYSFELHWQVDAFQMGTNNIHFYIYVVGTHLNFTDKLMQLKWVTTTYTFIYMLWVLIWIALTNWCISNCTNNIRFYIYVVGTPLNCTDKVMYFKWVPTTYAYIYMLSVLIWTAMTSQCKLNGYQQYMPLWTNQQKGH